MADDGLEDIPAPQYGGMTPREWKTKYRNSTNKQKAAGIQQMLDQAKALREAPSLTQGQTFGAPLAALGDIGRALVSKNIQDNAIGQRNALLGDEQNAAASYDQARLRGLSPALQGAQDEAAALRAPAPMDITAGNSPSEAAPVADAGASPGDLPPEHQAIISSFLKKLNPGNPDDLLGKTPLF